jgi:hypothetical protein
MTACTAPLGDAKLVYLIMAPKTIRAVRSASARTTKVMIISSHELLKRFFSFPNNPDISASQLSGNTVLLSQRGRRDIDLLNVRR